MHEPLKNCPFCGGAPTTIERPDNIDGTQFFYAIACYCGRHSACAHKMAVRKTPEIAKAEAIAAWNTRTPQPTQAQAGAVPLTDEQAKALLKNSDLLDMFLHIGWYSAPRKNFDAHGLTLIRAIEAAHGIGIKGGQHAE